VGMWKSASSISKVCGNGGKNSFIVFPMLSWPYCAREFGPKWA
jgi:hypothetical protein